ncbi:Carbon-nitrogen hydrolase [Vibrio crassostreae]|uniref:Carbon-nitrogen hydrolase n=1 Tax=Vibrio crassostreae TaxID=246167 RepID=A0A822N081_9VIBR|nr:carbon-nitrogen hydrolase family protein [Vibrio crassostreae]MDH5948855.1 carbon-nitrogen hydrolase family protein [Vibrio crassostreae]ROO65231.1 putative amidohydrolase [Vibrio crassostreae]ROS66346.1 putative amidohydrolase [Vibrio crassostreae]RPF56383.1 putative amidohydrolase [Vibrio crassostreae]TCL28295.1 putative amidohydrolase [Vibrio crassostreae]
MDSVSITLVQLEVEYKNKQKNLSRVSDLLEAETSVGDITLLPELFSTGYIFNEAAEIHELCEDFNNSPTIDSLTLLAAKHQTLIVAGIAEEDDGQHYNSVVVVDGSGLRHKYRKVSQTKFDKEYFSRGSELLTFQYKGLKFGVAICFDIWFPEIMRAYQLVDVILHPANFGGHHSFAIAQARALEEGCHLVTCNRVGQDVVDAFTATYCGGSRVYSPKGELVTQLSDKQSVESVSIQDLSIAPQYNGVDVFDEMQEIASVLSR